MHKSGILVLILTIIAVCGYEFFLRHKGFEISYDDSESLFANSRRKVYLPQDEATVFLGSSRIKYDIDTETWRQLTGETPVQLGFVGSRATAVLQDLAADPEFKGKVIIDATEGLLFDVTGRSDTKPVSALEYFHNETPSQRFSFHINTILESGFVFLDKDNFSLSPILEQIPLPARPGHFSFPKYPAEFSVTNFDRQNQMTENFIQDTTQFSIMRKVWLQIAEMGKQQTPPSPGVIDSIILDLNENIDIIISRGGQVVFLRPPSSGPLWQGEQNRFPRPAAWDNLLKTTDCKGVHFLDYPEISSFTCPEYSHLSRLDAIIYTKTLIRILQTEIGWELNNNIQQ